MGAHKLPFQDLKYIVNVEYILLIKIIPSVMYEFYVLRFRDIRISRTEGIRMEEQFRNLIIELSVSPVFCE